MYNMKPTFEFYDLPFAVKKHHFPQKKRDIAVHKRRTWWMHHDLSTIHFWGPITSEDYFGGPSDLFERQDSEDLGCIFEDSWFHVGSPWYHDENIHEKK